MKQFSSLCHTVWDCKYHIGWIPKCRRKVLYGKLRNYLGELFHELARQRESRIVEGHLCIDHIHMCIAIPPKYSVSYVVGYIKGKSAIAIARDVLGRAINFVGQSFWARGYYVSTVGRDEKVIREYIRNQEAEDRRLDQLSLLK
ncbi:MAG: IS200/IS605 family transposase [Desulfovibrio sp.]